MFGLLMKNAQTEKVKGQDINIPLVIRNQDSSDLQVNLQTEVANWPALASNKGTV